MDIKLTKSLINRLSREDPARDVFLWDTQVSGFGVRVTRRSGVKSFGIKSFIVQRSVNGRMQPITLGRCGQLTLEQALELAQQQIAEPIRRGKNVRNQSVVPRRSAAAAGKSGHSG